MENISQDYLKVLFGATLFTFGYLATTLFFTSGIRRKIYTNKFMDNFKDTHKQATGSDSIGQGGYPDTGNGWYSQDLPYKDWYMMSCG